MSSPPVMLSHTAQLTIFFERSTSPGVGDEPALSGKGHFDENP
jgi:hypothetical protein